MTDAKTLPEPAASLAVFLHSVDSPLGPILLMTRADGALLAVEFSDHKQRLERLLRRFWGISLPQADTAAPAPLAEAFAAYFGGQVDALAGLPIAFSGTPFQQRAWRALCCIPAGKTITYAEQANGLGTPKAVRAVGNANGANPLGLVVPCHRVVASRGGLGGYAGGLSRKAWLLQHEATHAPQQEVLL